MNKWEIASQFFTSSPDLFLIVGQNGEICFANRAFKNELGHDPRKVIAQPFWSLLHPDDLLKVQEQLSKVVQEYGTIRSMVFRLADSENEYIWYEWNGFFSSEHTQIFLTGRNITSRIERKKNEEDFLQETQRIGRIGGWKIILPENELYWSEETYNLHEIPVGQKITVEEAIDFYAPSSRAVIADAIQLAISRGTPFDEELELYSASGKRLWVRAKGHATFEGGDILSVQGVFQDITEITNLRRSQEASKRQAARIAENFPGVLFQMSQDRSGVICFPFISERIFELTGISVAEVLSDPEQFFRHIPLTDRSRLFAQIKRSSETNMPFEWEGRVRIGNEEEIWVMIRCQPDVSKGSDAQLWDGVIIDVTETKKIQRELESQRMASIQGAKMASLGEMAGGIAHEVNNPLAIINGMASQLKHLVSKKKFEDIEKLLHYISKIETTTKRIADIVRGLRAFSRNSEQDPFETRKLAEIIQDAIELGKERMRYHAIELKINIDSTIEVECRDGQIIQVFVNLLSNSFYAIKDQEDKWISISAKKDRGYIRIEFQDSGPGIPQDIKDRIMEPFFTTKEVGVGTGLGLSISKGIIGDHNGDFTLSEEAEHTTFLITLPIHQNEENSLPAAG